MSWQHYHRYHWGEGDDHQRDREPDQESYQDLPMDESKNDQVRVEDSVSETGDEAFDRQSSGFEEPGHGDYFLIDDRAYNTSVWAYRFPADQEEVMRLDRQHYVMLESLPGLYRGPVDEILQDRSRLRRCLDIGCGTGIWLAEMAERFPHVDCVGIDLMPLQHSHQLSNCTYMCVEAPQGLKVFPNKSFDVVHLRSMLMSIPDYPGTLQEVYRLLRPGGIVLIHEPQLYLFSTIPQYTAEELAPNMCNSTDSDNEQWMAHFRHALAHRGIQLDLFQTMEDVLANAGFNKDTIDTFFHYRKVCPCSQDSELEVNETLNSRAFLSAAKLVVLEAGALTREQIDTLETAAACEIHGQSSGAAGPLGGRGVVSPWGYWVATK